MAKFNLFYVLTLSVLNKSKLTQYEALYWSAVAALYNCVIHASHGILSIDQITKYITNCGQLCLRGEYEFGHLLILTGWIN